MLDKHSVPVALSSLPQLLTIREVRELLRVSRATAYDLVRRGDLPAVRFGRVLRVPRSALIEIVEQGGSR